MERSGRGRCGLPSIPEIRGTGVGCALTRGRVAGQVTLDRRRRSVLRTPSRNASNVEEVQSSSESISNITRASPAPCSKRNFTS